MGHPDFAAFVWRADAALAHHATGDAEAAIALADAQVAKHTPLRVAETGFQAERVTLSCATTSTTPPDARVAAEG